MTLPILVLTLLCFQAPQAIDNQRVQVRELDGASDSLPYDSVWVSRAGHAAFLKKGAKHAADGVGILIGLKDFKQEPLANKSGQPLAFPRPGSKKLIENTRVIVWDYTWTPGVATPIRSSTVGPRSMSDTGAATSFGATPGMRTKSGT